MPELRVLPDLPSAVPGVWPAAVVDVALDVAELELLDAELRLLAQAAGEGLPPELALRVQALRAQRLTLTREVVR